MKSSLKAQLQFLFLTLFTGLYLYWAETKDEGSIDPPKHYDIDF